MNIWEGPVFLDRERGTFIQIRGQFEDDALLCSEESRYYEGARTTPNVRAVDPSYIMTLIKVGNPEETKGVIYDGTGYRMGDNDAKQDSKLTNDEKVLYDFFAFLFERELRELAEKGYAD